MGKLDGCLLPVLGLLSQADLSGAVCAEQVLVVRATVGPGLLVNILSCKHSNATVGHNS